MKLKPIKTENFSYTVGEANISVSLSLYRRGDLFIAVLKDLGGSRSLYSTFHYAASRVIRQYGWHTVFVYQFSGFNSESIEIKPFWEYVDLTPVEFPNEILLVNNPQFYRLNASNVERAVKEAVRHFQQNLLVGGLL